MSSITSHKATNGKDGQWHQQRVSYIFNAFDPSGAGDKETKTSNLKMSNVFGDPKLLAQVRAWLIGNQKGEERLLFMLEAMKKLRYEASAGLLEDHGMAALELYQTYLMNGAEREINLEPALRFDVLDRIDQCLSIDEVSLLSCYTLITTSSCFIICYSSFNISRVSSHSILSHLILSHLKSSVTQGDILGGGTSH